MTGVLRGVVQLFWFHVDISAMGGAHNQFQFDDDLNQLCNICYLFVSTANISFKSVLSIWVFLSP